MADDEQPRPEETPLVKPGSGFWPDWLTPRRVPEFARNVIVLEQSVKRLQEENRDLHQRMDRLQTQMTQHNAQLTLLVDFVKESIFESIDARTEVAVRKLLSRRRPRAGKRPRRKDKDQ
jgi:hypothetical protein